MLLLLCTYFVAILMTLKGHQKILGIERNFSGIFEKNIPPIFETGGAPPPTKIGRCVAADKMTLAPVLCMPSGEDCGRGKRI